MINDAMYTKVEGHRPESTLNMCSMWWLLCGCHNNYRVLTFMWVFLFLQYELPIFLLKFFEVNNILQFAFVDFSASFLTFKFCLLGFFITWCLLNFLFFISWMNILDYTSDTCALHCMYKSQWIKEVHYRISMRWVTISLL